MLDNIIVLNSYLDVFITYFVLMYAFDVNLLQIFYVTSIVPPPPPPFLSLYNDTLKVVILSSNIMIILSSLDLLQCLKPEIEICYTTNNDLFSVVL